MPEWHFIDWQWQRVWDHSRLAPYVAQQLCSASTRFKTEKHE